tara:strand:+ start:198 stop:635 length:438 start_codon:yes stop_codon:yes gene_type:complete
VKKKYIVRPKDKNDWANFTKNMGTVTIKDSNFTYKNLEINHVPKLDLHGYSLDDANTEVKKFIIESYKIGYRKILIITGKGLRSKSHKNPYLSDKLSVLKNSVPDYIKSNETLSSKIKNISFAEIKDGGEGAIYIYLRKSKKIKE